MQQLSNLTEAVLRNCGHDAGVPGIPLGHPQFRVLSDSEKGGKARNDPLLIHASQVLSRISKDKGQPQHDAVLEKKHHHIEDIVEDNLARVDSEREVTRKKLAVGRQHHPTVAKKNTVSKHKLNCSKKVPIDPLVVIPKAHPLRFPTGHRPLPPPPMLPPPNFDYKKNNGLFKRMASPTPMKDRSCFGRTEPELRAES
eukprot:scaffold1640_cov101-Cylindrotheca_fusiformis.AAC.8